MTHRIFPLVLAVIGSTIALRAEATPAHRIALRLDYQPDPSHGCPTSDELGFMLAAEFGYPIVRDDATGLLRVVIRPAGGKYEAELSAPNPSGSVDDWQWRTDKQATCRELAYDVATTVGIALGPRAWPSDQPPVTLAAPLPIIDVQKSAVVEMDPPQDRLAAYTQSAPDKSETVVSPPEQAPSTMRVEAAIGGVISPYGLPSVGVGGGGMFALRWPRAAVMLDVRGAITPSSQVGEQASLARTSLIMVSVSPCVWVRVLDVCAQGTASRMAFDLPLALSDGFSIGIGARLMPRWRLSNTFALFGYADVNAELRSIILKPAADGVASGAPPAWSSPNIRFLLGIGVAATLLE